MMRCTAKAQRARHIALAALLLSVPLFANSLAQPPQPGSSGPGVYQTPEQAFTEAMRNSIGAPALAELGSQATVRLSDDLIIVPREQAARLLTIWGMPVPPDFIALLMGPNGMSSPGIIRYVPAGFTDLSEAAHWSADDYLSSLRDTVANRNAERLRSALPKLEARGWIRPPHVDSENKRITWAALILPTNAPMVSDGETTFNAAGFGRHGYVSLAMTSSVQEAAQTGAIVDAFLNGLVFRPGEAYGNVEPADARSPAGLAGVLGFDALHQAGSTILIRLSALLLPVAGGLVALIGAVSLVIHARRTWIEETRRW